MRRLPTPSIAMLVVRVVVITVLATLFSFAVALFLGIATILLVDMARGGGIDLASAYRHVALPVAIGAFIIALAVSLVTEIKHYRQVRAAARREFFRAA